MKKVLAMVAGALMMAVPALAAETATQAPAANSAAAQQVDFPVLSKFKVKIGGYVKFDYAYNSVNQGPNGVISSSSGQIPAKGLSATADAQVSQDQSIFSMRQSRLWLKVDGPTFFGAKTGALIEGDFYGDASAAKESTQFRMRLGYGTIDWATTHFLFGQYWDIFAPMVSSTQDFRSGASWGAPNSPRSPQLKLTQDINFNVDNQLQLVFGVQDPEQYGDNQAASTTSYGYGSYVNAAGQILYINKSLGTAPGYFGMSMKPLTVEVFGLYGSEHAPANGNRRLDSYGYGLYTFVPVLKSADGKGRAMTMSFEGQSYVAANMTFNGATMQSSVGTSANPGTATGLPDPTGNLAPAKTWAATAQVIFYPTQDLGITAGWGSRYAINNSDYFSTLGGTGNYMKQNQQFYGNVAYDLNAAVRLAAEYQNQESKYVTGTGAQLTGVDNTIRLCAYYFF